MNTNGKLFKAANARVQAHMDNNPPSQIIGHQNREGAYLTRWHAITRNRWANIYIHRFDASDDDRALHDHPWPSISLMLSGEIDEITKRRIVRRRPGDIVWRGPWHAHRLVLVSEQAVTLFITGPRVRGWGFHCPKGWVHWRTFVDPNNPGERGTGCGEFD